MLENINEARFLAEYDKAIHEFVKKDYEKLTKMKIIGKHEQFLISFYSKCLSMIENEAELTYRQRAVIEKEMRRKKVKVPCYQDYMFSLMIPFSAEIDGKMRTDMVELGALLYILNEGVEEFKKDYRECFEKGMHVEKYHKQMEDSR